MTETAFARTFIALCDNKPTKLSSTHVEDPRTYPPRSAYILPKFPPSHALRKPASSSSSSTTPQSLTVHLKSARPPSFNLTLQDQDLNTSVLDLKSAISEKQGIPAGGIKLLYKKRPVGDSKVLKEFLGDDVDGEMDFGVMVVGGGAGKVGGGKEAVGAEEGMRTEGVGGGVRQSGIALLKGEDFWADLRGFLVQRLRDEGVGEEVFRVFKGAWERR